VKPRIEFNQEKNLLLKATRGIDFDDVIDAIERGSVLDDLRHTRKKNQRILVVKIQRYIYAVPYVFDNKKEVMFLKTIYPSRVLRKKYLKTKE